VQVISHEFGGFFIADMSFPDLRALVQYYYNIYLSEDTCLEVPLAPSAPVEVRYCKHVLFY
jgi:hypothetical protein